jgi:hypothetical protein
MKRKVSFHQLAEFELNDAAIFLENERQGLGGRFLNAVEAGVAHIHDYPEAAPIIIEKHKVQRIEALSLQHHVLNQAGSHSNSCRSESKARRPFYWHGRE